MTNLNTAGYTLRAYQTESVGKVRQAIASGKRSPVMVLPTGGLILDTPGEAT